MNSLKYRIYILAVLAIALVLSGCNSNSKKSWTVTFEDGFGAITRKTVTEGSTVTPPDVPTDKVPDGYKVFNDWRVKDTTTPYDFSTPVSSDLYFKAYYYKDATEDKKKEAKQFLSVLDALYCDRVEDADLKLVSFVLKGNYDSEKDAYWWLYGGGLHYYLVEKPDANTEATYGNVAYCETALEKSVFEVSSTKYEEEDGKLINMDLEIKAEVSLGKVVENEGKYSIEKESGSWPNTARPNLKGYIKSNNSKKNMMLVLKVDDKDYITLTRDMSSESSDMFNIGYVDSTGDYIFGI